MSAKILIGLVLFSLLPVWRAVGGTGEGMNLWQYLDVMTDTERSHIPYWEATQNASWAYRRIGDVN